MNERMIINQTDNCVLSRRQQIVLDVYRIVAALMVLFGHSFSFYELTVFKDQTYFPFLQNIGVVMFFLLSGFLTVFSLSKKNVQHQYSFSKYVKHRAARIYREYLPGLCIIAIIDAISVVTDKAGYEYYQSYNIKTFLGNLLMLQNMGPRGILGRFFVPLGSGRPLWTLSIEWWLYMLVGAIFLFLSNKVRLLVSRGITLGVILFMVCEYLITGRGGGLGFVFALGVLGFYIYDLFSKELAYLVLPLSILMYVIYGLLLKDAYTIYSFIILWIMFCSMMKIGKCTENCNNRNPILAFVSKSSFMLYLIHYSIIYMFVISDIPWSKGIKFCAGIVLSLVLSGLAYYVFGEKNVMGRFIGLIKRERGT